jgi:glycosyltransferase involved in cell wall biosynthesis
MHICVSEDIIKYMEQYFKNTVTIHSCVDLNRFSSLSNSNILKNRKKLNVLYVGAFTNQKGVDVLIKAFSKIDLQHHDVALHLVGDGLLFNKMKQLIDSLNIEKYVNLYGARKDVEKFYLASDLIVCPSVSGEGSSGVIKEGMAAGKIVVASNLDANKELIDDKKSGLLFENSNSKELSTILLKIINNEINIPEKSIKDKIKQFECKHTINQHINIYKNIILKHM